MPSPTKKYTKRIVRQCDDKTERLTQTVASLARIMKNVRGTGKVDKDWLLPRLESIRETGKYE